MIKTTTYMGGSDVERDVLSAFSAVDRSNTAAMEPDEVATAFRRLVSRLAAITSLHGEAVPSAFLSALAAAEPEQSFAIVNQFLETGRFDAAATDDGARELQQEIVHFSRIVDVDFAKGVSPRRLAHSDELSDSVKVLIELVTVARSRMLARGANLPTPPKGRPDAHVVDIDDLATVSREGSASDHVLVITGPRRRQRRMLAFRFNQLLAYLTPAEAMWVMASSYCEDEPAPEAKAWLVTSGPEGPFALSWQPGTDAADDIERCRSGLPTVLDVAAPIVIDEDGLQVELEPNACAPELIDVKVVLEGDVMSRTQVPAVAVAAAAITEEEFVRAAEDAVAAAELQDIASIEFGHIHLDRDLDVDQEVGIAIGARVSAVLAERQASAPQNALMIDDDHVIVKLRPSAYRSFVTERLSEEQDFVLIPESSPVIRAVVVALFRRLHSSAFYERSFERGDNLYVTLSNGVVVELFEDFRGQPVTGCVFFEAALLLYRSDPQRVTHAFLAMAGAEEDPQTTILDILDADEDHDSKHARITELSASFGELVDPHRGHDGFAKEIEALIDEMGTGTVHLNVLEDYYGVQQDKVRQLLRDLGLPLQLVTLAFNARTGAVRVIR